MTGRILIVDDEPGICRSVGQFLEGKGFTVQCAESCRAAEELCRASAPDVAIVDFHLPDGTGLDLLRRLNAGGPRVPTVFLTGHGSIERAVEAVKEGAEQFLTKPVALPALALLIEKILDDARLRRRVVADDTLRRGHRADPFVGASLRIRELESDCRAVLEADCTVLIQGETGVGKGILARWLHERGPRAREPFVDLNCAGLSRDLLESELFGHAAGAFTGAGPARPGLLEVAHRGTAFLDEIGDMDPQIQPRLLKALDEKRFRRVGDVRDRQVDVRLVAATHQDLEQLVKEGAFRQDLYFRISAFPLAVPALRERREDIPVLARVLLEQLSAELGRGTVTLAPEAELALESHDWPGNIRELRNVLERALIVSKGRTITSRELRFASVRRKPADSGPDAPSLRDVERRAIESALRENGWRVARAAAQLGTAKTTLYQKIRLYGLKRPSGN